MADPSQVTRKKTFCFDIDGVIATPVPGNQYEMALPIVRTINAINALYRQGHRIILFTARGSLTGLDWREVTKSQMIKWGVDYHELSFGKPAADYYVDDRSVHLDELYSIIAGLQVRVDRAGEDSEG